jgi:hypothetical protein
MKIEQNKWTKESGWATNNYNGLGESARLVLVFGSRALLSDKSLSDDIKAFYPKAALIGCSTSGEILDVEVSDESLVLTAIALEHTRIECAQVSVNGISSVEAGESLAKLFSQEELTHLLVLSDGLRVNGTKLVAGLTNILPKKVTISGGMSGDGAKFEETLVSFNGVAQSGVVAAVAFYGDRIKVGCGSFGGWDQFGIERLITKSQGNVLYELDGKSALTLYKEYLGKHARELPSSGLLFPLEIRNPKESATLVRTILSVNEENQSMTFAGDVPEGFYARLMKANFDRMIDGAQNAAQTSFDALNGTAPDLAVMISCVGRKLILHQRTEEEIEGVREVLGDQAFMTGFYSYGEIAPFGPEFKCELHNQTMTITTFAEI